ncbi:hypothetical protein ABENE_01665 [Asticcacaulis benevestitus DSM 16100 = ATCC BAA-896]|uniref:Uncharacterized protein n=2 Tax=Asticcacaulis TaxID=76890 RepID=V4RSU2_9CAUL|nr:hypothetical protein ABENE_01665 [Asticcacaulis benevestitus DSM 16100 = ATCC BAA-896]
MPPSTPSAKPSDVLKIKPLPKRLRNTLMSTLFCAGLIMAYHATTQNQPLPADAHISYEAPGSVRLDVDAEGHVVLSDMTRVYRYKISKFAVKRILRAFQQARFFERRITDYRGDCQLTLNADHQKVAIRHDCATTAPELSKPVEALDITTRFRRVLAGDKNTLRDYAVKVARRPS